MVTSPGMDHPDRPPPAGAVAAPSGPSAGYRSALLAALTALGPATGAGGKAHGRTLEAIGALERLDEDVLGSATQRGVPGRASQEMLEAAEKKAEQAERDLAEKRVPYEADPLFMYLWRRGFGTGAYRANSFVRYFDRKVARLVGYQGARANYATLLELPVRIREHAERLRAALGHGGEEACRAARLSGESAARYRTAVESADKAYAEARLSMSGGAGEADLAAAERALAEARAALLAKLSP